MRHSKQTKLENPERLAELDPSNTLRRLGLGLEDSVCDIGAGSGIFTMEAARMTGAAVYALEIDDIMLELIRKKAKKEKRGNIIAAKVEDGIFPVEDNAADLALLVTVLHEIENKADFLREITRILKIGGRVAVIEFHKADTPMGPPLFHRLGRGEVRDILIEEGFSVCDDFDLGENLYCLVFRGEKV